MAWKARTLVVPVAGAIGVALASMGACGGSSNDNGIGGTLTTQSADGGSTGSDGGASAQLSDAQLAGVL